jgi:hypothetical protein
MVDLAIATPEAVVNMNAFFVLFMTTRALVQGSTHYL